MDLQKVGKFIAERRKNKKLTQGKLGEIIGVTDTTISKWERGVNAPDISILNKLSEVLEVNVSEILNGCKIEERNQLDEDTTLKNIEYYTKIAKLKYIKISSYIIIGILTMFAMLFTMSNYNKFKVYSISSKNSEYTVEGYMIFNQERNLTIIKNIDIHDNFLGTNKEEKIKTIKASIICESKILFSVIEEKSDSETINSYLLNKTYFVDEVLSTKEKTLSHDIKLDKLKLNIEYVNIAGDKFKISIPLNIKEEYSNNKIIY